MIRKMFLCFICLSLFLSISVCKKKETPTSPIVPELILPTIEYFTANPTSIMLDTPSVLSWSTQNATNVMIDHGVGTVALTGTVMISPLETTVYTLTAINSDGQVTASCTVEIKKWAEVAMVLGPANPTFIWDPITGICVTEFLILIGESAGVGGTIDGILIELYDFSLLHSEIFPGGSFPPYGAISRYCPMVILGQPIVMAIWIEGIDDNGYMIEIEFFYNIYWFDSRGTASLQKIVEGANHHKLIK